MSSKLHQIKNEQTQIYSYFGVQLIKHYNKIRYDLTLSISEREQNDSYFQIESCKIKLITWNIKPIVQSYICFFILKLLARKSKHHHYHFSSP